MKRSLRVIFAAVALMAGFTMQAQKSGNSAAAMGNVGSITNGSAGTLSGRNPNLVGTVPSGQTMFLSGDVAFEDGTPANSEIRIERSCSTGGDHLETHADAKGHFSFQIGNERGNELSDAEYSSSTFGQNRSLMGCELRAIYPGYVSESVDISSHRSLDESRVGTLVLRRLVGVKGSTISVSSAEAPKSAVKDYEKGLILMQKGKYQEAESHFASAVDDYPKYAEAWVALGDVQQHAGKAEEAKKAFRTATSIDGHYVTPLDRLARLFAIEKNWLETVKYSSQTIELNPVEFPGAFWFNALANYSLKNDAEAEKSAQAVLKIDRRHRYPEAETMLAEFAARRGELEEAAGHLKAYLAEAPQARNTDQVKRELAQVEAARATQAKNNSAPAH